MQGGDFVWEGDFKGGGGRLAVGIDIHTYVAPDFHTSMPLYLWTSVPMSGPAKTGGGCGVFPYIRLPGFDLTTSAK